MKTVFTKDGVEVEKGTNKYKGHIFYDEDGGKYKCLGYFPKLDDCVYENLQTGKEVVGCMDGFYFKDPTEKYAKGSTVEGAKWIGRTTYKFKTKKEAQQRLDLMKKSPNEYRNLSIEKIIYIGSMDKSNDGYRVRFEHLTSDQVYYAKGSTIKGKSAFTFEGLDKRFQKLDWRDTTEAYYGLDFTPFMSVVEEYIEHGGKNSQGLDSHFEQLGWRDTTEAYYGLDFTPFMSEIENYATSKYAKGGSVNGFNYTIGGL